MEFPLPGDELPTNSASRTTAPIDAAAMKTPMRTARDAVFFPLAFVWVVVVVVRVIAHGASHALLRPHAFDVHCPSFSQPMPIPRSVQYCVDEPRGANVEAQHRKSNWLYWPQRPDRQCERALSLTAQRSPSPRSSMI